MLDKLIEFLKDGLEFFHFVTIIDQFERGIVLRFGRLHRHLEPGLHWFWPLKCEEVLRHPIVVDTQELGEQSLTTSDAHSITLTGVITFQVSDVEAVLLRVQGERQALIDSASGIIGTKVLESSWAEVISPDFWNEVTIAVRRRAKKYGIEVLEVQFKDLAKSRSLRIWNSNRYAEQKS